MTGGGGWTRNAPIVSPSNATDNVVVQSTLTVQGSAFSAGGSTLVVTNGNVGIATMNPQYALDVAGDIRATSSVYYGGTPGSADGTAYTKPDSVFDHGPAVDMTRMAFETVETAENLQLQLVALNKALKDQQAEI